MRENGTTDVNYSYLVHYIKGLPGWRSKRILDYGCGKGLVVELLRREGIECFGVDVFYAGASYGEIHESKLFQKGFIRAIDGVGDLPFATQSFDVVISNQVFEHVRDKASVLNRLNRVLKDDGRMYHHFPSLEVIREGHIGIPFVHWLPRGRLRYYYTVVLRALGLGYFKGSLPVTQWAKEKLDWLDAYCYYETSSEIHKLLSKDYTVSHREIDYCRFRARNRRLLRTALSFGILKGLYERLFRRLAFMAIELRKVAPGHDPVA